MSFKRMKMDEKIDDSDVSVSSEVEMDTFSIDYDIKNFNRLDKQIFSPNFVGGPKSQHQWKLQVNPKYKKDGQDTEYVGVYLGLVKKAGETKTSQNLPKDSQQDPVQAEFQFSLMNSERKVLLVKDSNGLNSFIAGSSTWGWNEFSPKSDVLNPKKGYLTDGHTLKIHCKVYITLGLVNSKVVSNNLKINSNSDPQSNVSSYTEKMSSFLDAGTFSDFTIKTKTCSFPVSKIILSARSDVFNSMFNSGMRESTENTIKIEDHSDEAVKGMLKFIYTGKIDLTEKDAGDLLAISDKYQVLDLKYKCEEFLLENLKIENAADTLIMAHFHSPTSLKPQVISFLNRHKQKVILTDGFKQMEITHPIIFADLYKSNS